MKTFFGVLLTLLLIVVIGGGLILFTPLGQAPLAALFPVRDVEPVDFATLRVTQDPNQFLMCPPGLCDDRRHAESPTFDVPAERLKSLWEALTSTQPGVRVLTRHTDGLQIDDVPRSARLRFPDIITVRFIPLPDAASTLAIYSRSLFGTSDWGVNRARIESWISELSKGG